MTAGNDRLAPVLDWEETAIPISALEHYAYCPRQCALIHVEQTYDENLFTLRGNAVHERVDVPGGGVVSGVRVERALPVWSTRLGLTGKADLVEYPSGVPYPVEYKHGPKRDHRPDDLQLCAYAFCLEEMTGQPVPEGAVYHASTRNRRSVRFDEALRQETLGIIVAIRGLFGASHLPPPIHDRRCTHCSLQDACMPALMPSEGRVGKAIAGLFVPSTLTGKFD